MIIGALMCVLYMGVAAEPTIEEDSSSSTSEFSSSSSSIEEESSSSNQEIQDTETSSEKETENTVSAIVSIQAPSSNKVSGAETSSQEVSSQETSSNTSSKPGYNAKDPTIGNNSGNFGDPASDTNIEFESQIVSKEESGEKNIFNLSKLLKGLIFIPIVLALASIGALIYVNRKELSNFFLKITDKKKSSGANARKKNKK